MDGTVGRGANPRTMMCVRGWGRRPRGSTEVSMRRCSFPLVRVSKLGIGSVRFAIQLTSFRVKTSVRFRRRRLPRPFLCAARCSVPEAFLPSACEPRASSLCRRRAPSGGPSPQRQHTACALPQWAWRALVCGGSFRGTPQPLSCGTHGGHRGSRAPEIGGCPDQSREWFS